MKDTGLQAADAGYCLNARAKILQILHIRKFFLQFIAKLIVQA